MNELTKPNSGFGLVPQSIGEAMQLADMLASSDLVPKDYQRKPGNILVAVQWGAEVGLKPLQALQNIAVINNRPALWGDALVALVRGSGLLEYMQETADGDTATCRVKRRGQPEEVRTFSQADAKAAGLAGKTGPWSQYPARMRQLRARAFALRDVFADVLKGLPVAEEVQDMPVAEEVRATPRHMGEIKPVVQAIAAGLSPELLAECEAAAAQGVTAYADLWRGLGRDERRALAGEHERLKGVAVAADAAKVGPWIDKIDAAASREDALAILEVGTLAVGEDDRQALADAFERAWTEVA